MGPEAESMRGTSVPVWVRRSTFVERVGGGTKADRRWLCRGTTKDAPGLREVEANRQKTRKPRATRIDVGVEVIDDALRDPTDHAVMWSLSLCGGRHLLALDLGTSPTGRPHKLGSGPTNLTRQPAEFARSVCVHHRPSPPPIYSSDNEEGCIRRAGKRYGSPGALTALRIQPC
jgi:hypothetical protein